MVTVSAAGDVTPRERILRAAKEAIEEHGPEALTSQIAHHAGLARPNVYRHFPSKDELDLAVARSANREMLAVIRDQLRLSGTPVEVIQAPIAAQVVWAERHPNLYRFVVSREFHRFLVSREFHRFLVSSDYGRSSDQRRAEPSSFAAEFAAAGARYVPRFSENPDAAEAVVIELAGLIDASILRWLVRRTETCDQLIDRLTADVWLIFDSCLRRFGVYLDPASPLPQAE